MDTNCLVPAPPRTALTGTSLIVPDGAEIEGELWPGQAAVLGDLS